MDWYCYFKERFTWGSNPYASVEKCQQIVDEMMMNPIIPSRISTEAVFRLFDPTSQQGVDYGRNRVRFVYLL